MKQLRPRSLTIYSKQHDNITETDLAKQTHESFIKSLQDKIPLSDSVSEKTANSYNTINSKIPIFKGDKKKYQSEPFHKDLSKKKSSGFLSTAFSFLGGRSNSTSGPQEVKEYTAPIGENIYFSDKAFLTSDYGKDRHLKQPEHSIPMNIATFLGQYATQDDLANLDIKDITDIDNEKLHELKEKSIEFIDATSKATYTQEGCCRVEAKQEDVVLFFNEKLEELNNNDTNIQIFLQNLPHVNGISYEKNGARVFFKK